MLALTVLNVVIGNADAHSRNMSILHYRNGRMELAPGYDLTPTAFYRGIPTRDGAKDMSDELGMFINRKRSVHQVNRQDLLLEGENWGLSRIAAAEVIERAIQRIRTYIEQPVTSKLPASIMEFFAQRLQNIESGGYPDGAGGGKHHITAKTPVIISAAPELSDKRDSHGHEMS